MPIMPRRSSASRSSSSAVTSWPASSTRPPLARSRPASTISKLVLPEPEGPTSPTASPASMSRSTPRRMLTGPPAPGRRRSRTLTSGAPNSLRFAEYEAMSSIIARAYGLRAAPRRAMLGALLAAVLAAPLPCPARASPVRLLVLGDSLAAGYGLPHAQGFEAQLHAALAAHGYAVRVIDGAVSGDTSAGGLARLDWVLAEKPQAAIVELGANDGLRGLDPKEMARNLGAILDKLQAAHVK